MAPTLSRTLKLPGVIKGYFDIDDGGEVTVSDLPAQPLELQTLFESDHPIFDDLPGPDQAGIDTVSSTTQSINQQILSFFRRHMVPTPSPPARDDASHAQIEQQEFADWVDSLNDLVRPYLAATRGLLPSHSAWDSLACGCPSAVGIGTNVHILDIHGAYDRFVHSCPDHIAQVLVHAGAMPATIIRPKAAFSFFLLRLFHTLQENARVGAYNFSIATYQLHRAGSAIALPTFAFVSRDSARRPLRSASEWLQALEKRSISAALGPAELGLCERPTIDDDTYTLTLTDCAERCPACFGRLLAFEQGDLQAEPCIDDPQLIVCLDGNFQQKRERRPDAVRRTPRSPSFFLSPSQLKDAKDRFESKQDLPDPPRTGCTSEVRAAIEGTVKTTKVDFDIGGVIGMTCRHGSPLALVNVQDSGESHYYGWALLEALLNACGEHLHSLGVCYDIGCKLAVSPRLEAALEDRPHRVRLVHVVSIFHVYGHDFGCQMKYSPRRTPGFGLTDGEALERLWSSLADLVPLTRKMSEADRNSTLTSRLESLARDHSRGLMDWISKRIVKIVNTRKQSTQDFLDRLQHILLYTGQTAEEACAECCPKTGLPKRASDFLRENIDWRRAIAFKRDKDLAKLSKRRLKNTRNRIIDLSLVAQELRVPLQSWHALTAVIKQRPGKGDQHGTARLTISKAGSAREAHSHLAAFNKAIEAYRGVLGPAQHALRTIQKQDLFRPETLTYVRGLLGKVDYDVEPWVVDAQLATLMDITEVLLRLEEEESRLMSELQNMGSWFRAVDIDLHVRLDSLIEDINSEPPSYTGGGYQDTIDGSAGDPMDEDRDGASYTANNSADFLVPLVSDPGGTASRQYAADRAVVVARLLGHHHAVFGVWKARLQSSVKGQQLYIKTLETQRRATDKLDRQDRMDHLIERQELLLQQCQGWLQTEPRPIPPIATGVFDLAQPGPELADATQLIAEQDFAEERPLAPEGDDGDEGEEVFQVDALADVLQAAAIS
ncbi:hypothetical protein OC844_006413 [Tilletia horrida]|nr:hypothetical protein OC844_006413 [Tilletia horrida]